MKNIHRGQLLKTLELPDKMDPKFEARYENVPCYDWWIVRSPQCRPGQLIGCFNIVVTKSKTAGRSKSSAHRIFIECSCGVLVPTGRTSQHKCDAKHRAAKVKSLMYEDA